jgi:hypothetical protein
MKSRSTILLGALLALAAPAFASDPVAGDAAALTVVLENIQEPGVEEGAGQLKARMRVEGRAAHLPDGAIVHISLTVKDRHPDIQAALIKAEVNGGRYVGVKEWTGVTFAPMEYTTIAALNMLAQSPRIKQFLARELGYGAEHVETLGSIDTATGTAEERAEFARRSLLLMRDFVTRLSATRQQMAGVYESGQVPEGFEDELITQLRGSMSSLDDMLGTHVVLGEHHTIGSLKHTLLILSESWQQREESLNRAKADCMRAQQSLDVVQRDVEARLPSVGTGR